MFKPSFAQAAGTGPAGTPNALSPGLTKLGKLGVLLTSGIQGALAGRAAQEQMIAQTGGHRAGGFGTGFEGGYTLPFLRAQQQQQVQRGQLENALLGNQVQYAPQLNLLKILTGQSEIGKNQAEALKNTAEAGAIPTKEGLEEAQAEAANYKEDPNLGLIDLRTKQPVNPSALAPLTAEEATVLGKQAGDRVPVKLKNTASEIAARGLTTVNTAEGVFERNRITGQQTRLGSNPREITLDMPTPAYDKLTKDQTFVTRNQINANPGRYASPQADVNLPVLKQTLKEYASTKPGTAGGNALAFNTAIGHLGMLWDAAEALNNKNVPLFNSLAQKYAKETGSSAPTNFNTVRSAVNAEVAKVFKGGVPADAEIQEQGQNVNQNSSPQQLRDNIRILVGLMNSRMSALQDRYKSVVGEENEDLLSKESRAVLQRIQSAQNSNRPPLSSFEH